MRNPTDEIKREGDFIALQYLQARQENVTENEINYKKYFYSCQWKQIRKQMRSRFGNRCQGCNDSGQFHSLEVHHRTYARFGNEVMEDLTLLCKRCHAAIHQGPVDGQANEWTKTLRRKT